MTHTLQVQAETVILNQIKSYQGTAFQEFGDRLLSKLYPEEYVAVRAGGNWGDLKNDGYCHINRIFFHFYSSHQNNVAALKAKITADIDGCLAKQQQVERIVFVTNDANLGVIEAHIDGLRLKHGIPIDTWGPARLVEIICALPPKDIAGLFNMVYQEQQPDAVTTIKYAFNTKPFTTLSPGLIAIGALIGLSCIVAWPLVFWYGFWPMHFGWWCLSMFLLFGGAIGFHGFITMAWKVIADGDQWQLHGVFYRKEGRQWVGYQKVAPCPYPKCNGTIVVDHAPLKEQKRFKMVGCCTVEPKIHTFSYNYLDVGYPVQLDFSEQK